MKNILLTILKIGISIAILAWLISKDWEKFAELEFASMSWGWMAVGLACCLASHLLGFIRWRLLVRALNLPFSWMDAIRIGFIGNFFGLFAFGVLGGDTVRGYYVTRHHRERMSEAISTVFVDRLIGLATMFVFVTIAYLMIGVPVSDTDYPGATAAIRFACQFSVFITICTLLGIAVLFFAPGIANAGWFIRVTKLKRVGPIIKKLTDVVLGYRSQPGLIATCVLASVGVNVCFAISIYSIAAGVGSNFPTFANHFVLEPIAMVANAVPLPGGVGGMEFALDVLYRGFSSPTNPSESGVVVAILFRLCLLVVAMVGAAFWFMNKNQMPDEPVE